GSADIVVPYHANPGARPWYRRVLTRGSTALMNLLFGQKLRYYQGPCVYPTGLARSLPTTTRGFFFLAEMLIQALRRGRSFGDDVLPKGNPALAEIRGDVRDADLLRASLRGMDAVIHLACISNDPSFELDPGLSRSINYDAFEPLVAVSRQAGVRRFIYASTSSVYGVSNQPNVTEDHPLVPLTDYNKYKGMCEPILARYQSDGFTTVTIRPATVCGYSPRLRLDLTVNILTNLAVNTRRITIFGG